MSMTPDEEAAVAGGLGAIPPQPGAPVQPVDAADAGVPDTGAEVPLPDEETGDDDGAMTS